MQFEANNISDIIASPPRRRSKHLLLYARIRRACLMHKAINKFYSRDVLRILRNKPDGLSVTEVCEIIFGDSEPGHHSVTSRSLTTLLKYKLVRYEQQGQFVIYRLDNTRIKKINTALKTFNQHSKIYPA